MAWQRKIAFDIWKGLSMIIDAFMYRKMYAQGLIEIEQWQFQTLHIIYLVSTKITFREVCGKIGYCYSNVIVDQIGQTLFCSASLYYLFLWISFCLNTLNCVLLVKILCFIKSEKWLSLQQYLYWRKISYVVLFVRISAHS